MKIICNTVQNRTPRTSKNVKGEGHPVTRLGWYKGEEEV